MGTSTIELPPLPAPDVVLRRIEAVEDELRALRRLLRASRAAAKAEEARRRGLALPLREEVSGAR
jgi:hypothetical protein